MSVCVCEYGCLLSVCPTRIENKEVVYLCNSIVMQWSNDCADINRIIILKSWSWSSSLVIVVEIYSILYIQKTVKKNLHFIVKFSLSIDKIMSSKHVNLQYKHTQTNKQTKCLFDWTTTKKKIEIMKNSMTTESHFYLNKQNIYKP